MLFVVSIESLKNLKLHSSDQLFLFIICSKCKNENEKSFKEGELIETLKVMGLIENV